MSTPKIAIQGSKEKGAQIIALLEHLGGKNTYKHFGIDESAFYFIDNEGNIYCSKSIDEVFTILDLIDAQKQFATGGMIKGEIHDIKTDELYLCDVQKSK